MKSLSATITLAVGAVVALTLSAQAQVPVIEPINVTIVTGQPVELVFPNVFDLTHPKVLHLDVNVGGPPGTSTPLEVRFDWLDAAGLKVFSPITSYNVLGGGFSISETFTIPFCPREVSVDFFMPPSNATWPLVIQGFFTHECLVPEVSTVLPAGVGLAAVLGLAWRRRGQAAA